MNALFWLSLIAGVPGLFWDQGIESAAKLKENGIRRVVVPAAQIESWKSAGFDAEAMEPAAWEGLAVAESPGVDRNVSTVSPTRRPFIVANGWRFLRNPKVRYRYEAAPGRAALAAAEAHAYGVDAVIKIDARDVEAFGRMVRFLAQRPAEDLRDMAQIAVVDDGTDDVEEVMNLLGRRNLLYRPVHVPDPRLLTIRLGSKKFPREAAKDPSELASTIRQTIGDDRRMLRVFGAETVICRMVGDRKHARIHLVNYGGSTLDGLRVRLLGAFARGSATSDLVEAAIVDDHRVAGGTTEFTLPTMQVYEIVELPMGSRTAGAAGQ